MTKVLLFDIDHTLLYSGGAGILAMDLAFRDQFGLADGFATVEFSGRTDTAILRDALRIHHIDGDFPTLLERFKGAYFHHLEETLPVTKGSLMPGIASLLEELSARDDVLLGLATGNFRRGAELKLRHYHILHYFRDGGFGDDSEDRARIVRLAVQRLAGGLEGAHRVVVIGDTPHDIASAQANGAIAVGVATGKYSLEDLRRCGADIALPDLSESRTAIAALVG